MEDQDRIEALANLLSEAKHAHGEAFAHVGGADPDWAQWYAEHLVEPMRPLFGEHAPADIAALLEACAAAKSDEPWPRAYARIMVPTLT